MNLDKPLFGHGISRTRRSRVALTVFRIGQEITALDGDKLSDRHFKIAISRYLDMATAAINTLAGMARDKR